MHPSYALEELLALESAIRLEAQTEAWLDGGRSRFLALSGQLRELPSSSTITSPGVLAGLCALLDQVRRSAGFYVYIQATGAKLDQSPWMSDRPNYVLCS